MDLCAHSVATPKEVPPFRFALESIPKKGLVPRRFFIWSPPLMDLFRYDTICQASRKQVLYENHKG